MLKLIIPGDEVYDEETHEFSTVNDVVVELEHSLVSLSKWESIYQKPFLAPGEKTPDEVFGYIKAMLLTPDVPDAVLMRMTEENVEAINNHIESKMSATWFSETPQGRSSEIITSELIYYWMTMFHIPMECENWHLNRLFTLIKICSVKNSEQKPRSKADIARQRRELNAKRKAQLGTSG